MFTEISTQHTQPEFFQLVLRERWKENLLHLLSKLTFSMSGPADNRSKILQLFKQNFHFHCHVAGGGGGGGGLEGPLPPLNKMILCTEVRRAGTLGLGQQPPSPPSAAPSFWKVWLCPWIDIWIQNDKYIQMSTNRPIIGSIVLEIALSIYRKYLQNFHFLHKCNQHEKH